MIYSHVFRTPSQYPRREWRLPSPTHPQPDRGQWPGRIKTCTHGAVGWDVEWRRRICEWAGVLQMFPRESEKWFSTRCAMADALGSATNYALDAFGVSACRREASAIARRRAPTSGWPGLRGPWARSDRVRLACGGGLWGRGLMRQDARLHRRLRRNQRSRRHRERARCGSDSGRDWSSYKCTTPLPGRQAGNRGESRREYA